MLATSLSSLTFMLFSLDALRYSAIALQSFDFKFLGFYNKSMPNLEAGFALGKDLRYF